MQLKILRRKALFQNWIENQFISREKGSTISCLILNWKNMLENIFSPSLYIVRQTGLATPWCNYIMWAGWYFTCILFYMYSICTRKNGTLDSPNIGLGWFHLLSAEKINVVLVKDHGIMGQSSFCPVVGSCGGESLPFCSAVNSAWLVSDR